MKKPKILFLVVCVALWFGVVYSANADTQLSAKQMLLNKLQSSEPGLSSELYKTSSGMASYEIKTLSGPLVAGIESLKTLAGSKLNLDYKMNSPEKKIEANYDLACNQNKYQGKLFVDNNRLILSKEALEMLRSFEPSINVATAQDLPQYVYIVNPQFVKMFENLSRGQNIPPEYKNLLIFAVEAVPDKYFTTSLVNQKVSFSIDHQGLADVAFSILQKVKNEPETFATLVANIASASNPTVSQQEIMGGILKNLKESIDSGSYPDSLEKVQALLAAGPVRLGQLSYEVPLLQPGESKFSLTADFAGNPDFSGKITFNVDATGSKEDLNGTYLLNVAVQNNKQGINIDGGISGKFDHTQDNATSSGSIKVNVKDKSGVISMLEFDLEANSTDSVDKNVQINVPVLTEANSVNLIQYLQMIPETRIFVDGKPVAFDVAPFNQDERTMVPLRNLAEAMGCAVTWVEPDQINISRGDTNITMVVNQTSYMVNGVERQMDVAPFIKNGNITMIPLRTIAEELGYQVFYHQNVNKVFISLSSAKKLNE